MASEKYRVIRELGRGGMGVVYLAEDQELKREVALKVLYEHLNKESAFVARFQEEARSVATLHHPNIVCVHGLDRASGVLSIDMEYVEGFSLDQWPPTTPVSPHVAVAIARDVLSGLSVCHDIGIVHRDIKPSNILIQEDGTAKLTDFGLATAYASHLEDTVRGNTSSGFYMGTPRYMPVAAWEGGDPQPTWDTYAFGIVLYELLSGTVAFPGDNPLAIMKRHLTGPPPPLQSCTAGVSLPLATLVDNLVRESADADFTVDDALGMLRETPEFVALQDSNSTPTLSAPRPKRRRRRSSSRSKAGLRQIARLPLAALAVTGLIAAAYVATGLFAPTKAPLDTTPASGVGLREGAEGFVAMKALGTTNEHEVWMVESGTQEGELVLTTYWEEGFSRLRAEFVSDGEWSVSGGWAEYVYPLSRMMQYGNARGTLYWPEARGDLTMTLDRVREMDGETSSLTYAGSPVADARDREQYLRGFENATVAQSLLYSELLPRGFPWVVELESLLPAGEHTRYKVPFGEGEPQVDGELSESLWTRPYFSPGSGRIGEPAANVATVPATLKIRWNESAFLLAASVQHAGESVEWKIALLPDFGVSLQESARFLIHSRPGTQARFSYYLGAEEKATPVEWPVASASHDRENTLEMELPLAMLKESARPAVGKRWRVNVQCSFLNASGAREVVAQWGDDDCMALPHGALLVFEEPTP